MNKCDIKIRDVLNCRISLQSGTLQRNEIRLHSEINLMRREFLLLVSKEWRSDILCTSNASHLLRRAVLLSFIVSSFY